MCYPNGLKKKHVPVSASFITFGTWATARSNPMSITAAENLSLTYYDSASTPWLLLWGFWGLKAKDAASWVA